MTAPLVTAWHPARPLDPAPPDSPIPGDCGRAPALNKCRLKRAGASYGWEAFDDLIAGGFRQLSEMHYYEVALDQEAIPLDIDWRKYFALEAAGILKCWTVRVEGRLVGYVLWFVTGHIHYRSSVHALCDVFYLDPDYRQGRIGIEMFKTCEQALKADFDVKRAHCFEKLHLRRKQATIGDIFLRLGWRLTEAVYTKLL